MNSSKLASTFTWIAAAGFFLTALGHAMSFGQFSHDPALWFIFTIQQIVLGLILLLVARESTARARLFFLAAAAPLLESALMFCYLGPIVPSFLVLTSGLLPAIAGLLHARPSRAQLTRDEPQKA